LIDIIDYAENAGYVAPDARWIVASGEITIHPYKKRILEWVKNNSVVFSTNGFIFDEKIASILSANPRSVIFLSIDSGTPETWRKVKGVDNFSTVIGNLIKYRDCSRPGQIILKYIVLPSINDTPADYRALIEIMNVFDVRYLDISCDMRREFAFDEKAREALIRAASLLAVILEKNKMTYSFSIYQPLEQARIIELTRELLQTGTV
jgi:wyosine [tRNA(Phe)-imidazoG37] synthetase (radical SAM superfamily)